MLGSMKIRTRLWVLIGSALLTLFCFAAISVWMQAEDLIFERRAKVKSLTESAHNVLKHFGGLETSGNWIVPPRKPLQ